MHGRTGNSASSCDLPATRVTTPHGAPPARTDLRSTRKAASSSPSTATAGFPSSVKTAKRRPSPTDSRASVSTAPTTSPCIPPARSTSPIRSTVSRKARRIPHANSISAECSASARTAWSAWCQRNSNAPTESHFPPMKIPSTSRTPTARVQSYSKSPSARTEWRPARKSFSIRKNWTARALRTA